jgi:hypothetical protein
MGFQMFIIKFNVMKLLLTSLIWGCYAICIVALGCNEPKETTMDMDKYKSKAAEARKYCISKRINTRFFFLADMGRHSGLKRFFVWDFEKDTVVQSLMVSHGCGNYPWSTTFTKNAPTFSNEEGSHASSLGKYIIRERGPSQWGIGVKYLLQGMESTNNNAMRRAIVLHSWDVVTDHEVHPSGTPEGWGCPALSNNGMRIIDAMLKEAGSSTLLWVVE